eukprot:832421-Alexandrium_andersonii.AAC.1
MWIELHKLNRTAERPQRPHRPQRCRRPQRPHRPQRCRLFKFRAAPEVEQRLRNSKANPCEQIREHSGGVVAPSPFHQEE